MRFVSHAICFSVFQLNAAEFFKTESEEITKQVKEGFGEELKKSLEQYNSSARRLSKHLQDGMKEMVEKQAEMVEWEDKSIVTKVATYMGHALNYMAKMLFKLICTHIGGFVCWLGRGLISAFKFVLQLLSALWSLWKLIITGVKAISEKVLGGILYLIGRLVKYVISPMIFLVLQIPLLDFVLKDLLKNHITKKGYLHFFLEKGSDLLLMFLSSVPIVGYFASFLLYLIKSSPDVKAKWEAGIEKVYTKICDMAKGKNGTEDMSKDEKVTYGFLCEADSQQKRTGEAASWVEKAGRKKLVEMGKEVQQNIHAKLPHKGQQVIQAL